MADRDCSDATPRTAHTSGDYGFLARRHGGDVAAPYRGGSAGPPSEILVKDSSGLRWRWRRRPAPARLSTLHRSATCQAPVGCLALCVLHRLPAQTSPGVLSSASRLYSLSHRIVPEHARRFPPHRVGYGVFPVRHRAARAARKSAASPAPSTSSFTGFSSVPNPTVIRTALVFYDECKGNLQTKIRGAKNCLSDEFLTSALRIFRS